MITLKQNSYTDTCPMEEILQVAKVDSLNKAFSLMGYRFKGKPRKAQIAKGIVKHIKENPHEVLERLDATSLQQVKELLEKGKGNAIVLDGVDLFTPLQDMLLVMSYEDKKEDKTYIYLMNDLYDIFSPVIDEIDILDDIEDDDDNIDLTAKVDQDDFEDCLSMSKSRINDLINIAKKYTPKHQAVIVLVIDTIASASPMKMPFYDFIPYEDDINTLYEYLRKRKSDHEIGGIAELIMMDIEMEMTSYVGMLRDKELSFDDAYDMFGYMLFDLALEGILRRLHDMPPAAIDTMLKFKKVAGGEIVFEKIGEMAHDVFDECNGKLIGANLDVLNELSKD